MLRAVHVAGNEMAQAVVRVVAIDDDTSPVGRLALNRSCKPRSAYCLNCDQWCDRHRALGSLRAALPYGLIKARSWLARAWLAAVVARKVGS